MLVLTQLSNSLELRQLFWHFVNATAYHLGQYELSTTLRASQLRHENVKQFVPEETTGTLTYLSIDLASGL